MNKTNRNLNYFTLLTGYEPFQDFVKEIRNELGVPENGFKNLKEEKEWQRKDDDFRTEYFSSEKYKRMTRSIRKKFIDGEINRVMANKQMNVLDQISSVNKLTNACRYIIYNFNIPSHFNLALSVYILQNKIAFIPNNNFSHISDIYGKERSAHVVINSKLEKEELADLVKLVKELNKKLPTVSKVADSFMKKLSIEDWKKNSHVYDELINVSEISEEYLGKDVKSQQVYDAPRVLKRKREKLFGQKRT